MEENKTQQNNQEGLKTVKTYMSDMADTVRANEISVIKVALAEQNKQAREDLYRKAEGTPIKKVFWIVGGLILILGSIYGYYFIKKEKEKNNISEQIIKETNLISYDEISLIDMTKETDFVNKINLIKNSPKAEQNKNDHINYFSISNNLNGIKEKISIKDFFLGMNFTAPSSLVRSLSDTYMVGAYTKKGDTPAENISSLFLIFQTKDYGYSYAGMLEWEKTMASDMFDLFEFKTEENKIQIADLKFKDLIINNKDTRVLLNEKEEPILYYIFVNKDNIIVTDSKDAIKEINSRLTIKNIKPL